jgi:hypothetical protein
VRKRILIDPDTPTPPPPNINAYRPISPVDYAVMGGVWYAFVTPDGLTCVIDKGRFNYGCSGPIPAAPEVANLVSGHGNGARRPSPAPTPRRSRSSDRSRRFSPRRG